MNAPKRSRAFITPATVLKLLCSALLTAMLLTAVFRTESIDSLFSMLQNTYLPGVIAYASISLFALVVRALRYYLVLGVSSAEETEALETQKVTFGTLLIVTSIRNALVDFLPARLGELSYFYVLRRYGISMLRAVSVFGVCFALDIAVLALLLILLLLLSPYYLGMQALIDTSQLSAPVLVFGVVVLLFAFIALLRLDIAARIGTRILKTLSAPLASWRPRNSVVLFAERITNDISGIQKRGNFTLFVLLTVALRVSKYLSLYVLLLSVVLPLGVSMQDLDPVLSTVAFLAAEASASLPISGLMGFGAYEGAWTLIFSLSRAEIPSVPSVILLVHLITQVVGYSFGLLGLGFFLIKEVKN